MIVNKNFFFNKKILIYGLGKSGRATLNFLKDKKNSIYVFDDNLTLKKGFKIKSLKFNEILKSKFDHIIISPGIDIKKCKLKQFLKVNQKKIITDLDIFYFFYKNKSITITGTNGKSTTAKILYQAFKDQNKDVRLTGNIGKPILSEKNIKKNTLFIIEASSYQLEYSKYFKTTHGVILNITPDHLDRHGTLSKYIDAKFKLIKNQNYGTYSFLNYDDKNINKKIKSIKLKSQIVKIQTKSLKDLSLLDNLKNDYFKSDGNLENLLIVFEIIKKLKLKKINFFKTLNKFKGLKYRQQIIYDDNKVKIINDSKSTSFASSESVLKNLENIYWIVGGIPKKNDQFLLKKKYYKNFKTYVFGKNIKIFKNKFNNKFIIKSSPDLRKLLDILVFDIKKDLSKKKVIFFSPAAASFDQFQNFEKRGEHFNKLIKTKFDGKFKFN